MGGGGGGGGEQYAVVTGPTVKAAQLAAEMQVRAAGNASLAAAQNTSNAIQAIMSEYTTALGVTRPYRAAGTQAEAQYNYMLGLPAIAPGEAPVAPTAPGPKERAKFALVVGGKEFSENPYLNGPAAGRRGKITQSQVDEAYTNSVNRQLLEQQAIDSKYESDMANYEHQKAAYQQQLAEYNMQKELYDRYNAMGTAKAEDINKIVSNLPGYQYQFNQGVNAIQNAASAKGMLGSSNILAGLNEFGQGLASTYYNNYLNSLNNMVGYGAGASGQNAQQAGNIGAQVGQLFGALGDTQANAALAAGQAQATSYTSPAANQDIIAKPLGGGGGGGGGGGFGGALSAIGSIAGMFSSQELKEPISTPSTFDILESVQKLQLEKWKYKGIDAEHLGPYAEEFKQLFGVGDGKTINIIDAFGVLFSSVKELSKQIKELREGK